MILRGVTTRECWNSQTGDHEHSETVSSATDGQPLTNSATQAHTFFRLQHQARRIARPLLTGACLFGLAALGRAQPATPEVSSPRDAAPFAPSEFEQADPALPTLFIAGDSTATTGNPTHRGWGAVLIDYFDPSKLNIINRAVGGRSFRSFTREGRWDEIVNHLRPGDFVIIELGHNDGGDPANSKGRGDVPGTGDETVDVAGRNGTTETVHTYGWYTRKYIRETKTKGATPIVSTTTVRNKWHDDKVERGMGGMLDWAQQVAAEENALFLDHSDITADLYEEMGFDAVQKFFPADHTHTSTAGAIVNAETLVAGLGTLTGIDPILHALNDQGRAIEPHAPNENWGTYSPPPPVRGN